MRTLIDYITESSGKYEKYALRGLKKSDLRSGDILLADDVLYLFISRSDLEDLNVIKAYTEYWHYYKDNPELYQKRLLGGSMLCDEYGGFVLNSSGRTNSERLTISQLNDSLEDKIGKWGDVSCVFRGVIDIRDLMHKKPRSTRINAKRILDAIWETV
jgi:hypothetical protein